MGGRSKSYGFGGLERNVGKGEEEYNKKAVMLHLLYLLGWPPKTRNLVEHGPRNKKIILVTL
jgi:hypothetical protein